MARTAFLAAAALVSLVASSPVAPRDTNGTCTEVHQRKAWHNLSDDEKTAYLDAELCLINSPPKLNLPDCESRFDELVYAHIIQSNWIHNTGSFLPWHRYFMYAHEKVLRDECNYTGYQPYWEESLDAGDIASSAVFNTTTGFGGQGDDCVTDGPFANLTLSLNSYDGGSVYSSEYCLSRSFSDDTFELGNDTYIEECMAETNYTGALDCLMSTPHAAGHGGVGGTMLDVSASPAEPLFFLHHTNLDRLWWNWQQASPDDRTYDIGSERNIPLYSYASSMNFSYPSSSLIDYSGDDGNITTLNHVLWIAEIVPNVTINDVMDLSGSTICAEYV
ncbi:hypothetical protein Daus18300_009623 [Diaporthe australafricana]|uniref:Tyrosinase copper-binding domain-containing protein n=1 Tax=Diaporthe australafricana TaxID=127596 RepID=A0ABR3WDP1_9PEZI